MLGYLYTLVMTESQGFHALTEVEGRPPTWNWPDFIKFEKQSVRLYGMAVVRLAYLVEGEKVARARHGAVTEAYADSVG